MDDVIWHVENPQIRINKLSKVAGYKSQHSELRCGSVPAKTDLNTRNSTCCSVKRNKCQINEDREDPAFLLPGATKEMKDMSTESGVCAPPGAGNGSHDVHCPQSELGIQSDPKPSDVFCRHREIRPKMCGISKNLEQPERP